MIESWSGSWAGECQITGISITSKMHLQNLQQRNSSLNQDTPQFTNETDKFQFWHVFQSNWSNKNYESINL
jgi:hypothetical protein